MRQIFSGLTNQAIVVLILVLLTAGTPSFIGQNDESFNPSHSAAGRDRTKSRFGSASFVEASTTRTNKRERRIRRRTMATTPDELVTGELPPLSPEQVEEVYYDEDENGTTNTTRNPLFGPFGPKKFWKKQHKKGGLFGLGGPPPPGPGYGYGPNAFNTGNGYSNAGYNRPGLNLGAILGPIIGVAVMACILTKLCCLW